MAWCPICNAEYDDDNICPDCSVDLMNGNPNDYTDIFAFSNEEATLNIYNHLLEIGFETIQYYYDAKENLYHIICEYGEEADAKMQLMFYIREDLSCELTPTEKVALSRIIDSFAGTLDDDEAPKSYVSAEEKYANVNSSAISLLVVGFLGLAIILIDISGIYRFPFSGITRILFLGTLGLLFIIFVIMGIVSFKNAKKLAKQIKIEDNTQAEIRKYITDELNLASPDLTFDDRTSSEEKCLIRTEYITNRVKEKFPKADISFIDYIVEDLYDKLYPSD